MSGKEYNRYNSTEPTADQNGFVAWIKEHRAQLILVGISISTLITIVLCIKNKEALKAVWDKLRAEIKRANLYSGKWFENATKEELDAEREKVRIAYCSSGDDYEMATHFEGLLRRFDSELSKRAWGNETPRGPSYPREHGYNLYKEE